MRQPQPNPDRLVNRSIRIRVVRDIFEIIAFSAAGIWALWTFWYQASYEPEHAQPLVEWSVAMEREAVRPSDGMLGVRVHVRGTNKGKATLNLVSLVVTLSGIHVTRTAHPRLEPLDADAGSWQRELGAQRGAKVLLGTQGSRWGGDSSSEIDPEQEHTEEFLFWVDPGDFDSLVGSMAARSAGKGFDRGWYQATMDDAGTVAVEPTAACRAARSQCYVGTYETDAELPLWPAPVRSESGRPLAAPVTSKSGWRGAGGSR